MNADTNVPDEAVTVTLKITAKIDDRTGRYVRADFAKSLVLDRCRRAERLRALVAHQRRLAGEQPHIADSADIVLISHEVLKDHGSGWLTGQVVMEVRLDAQEWQNRWRLSAAESVGAYLAADLAQTPALCGGIVLWVPPTPAAAVDIPSRPRSSSAVDPGRGEFDGIFKNVRRSWVSKTDDQLQACYMAVQGTVSLADLLIRLHEVAPDHRSEDIGVTFATVNWFAEATDEARRDRAEKRRRDDERQAEWERTTYERLKAKFEGSS